MKAITLTAPWAWAIAHAGKDVENRKTRCPSLLGERIAIHAGVEPSKAIDWEWQMADFAWMRWRGLLQAEPVLTYGAIVAVTTVVGWISADGAVGVPVDSPHIGDNHRKWRSPWFTGPIGWLIHDVRALPAPVPARGKQGIWAVDADAEAAVLAQIGGA